MANLQVKDVPPEVHDELRRRARTRGVSVRDYVLALLRRDQAVPAKEDWAAALERLPPLLVAEPVTELLRAARDRGSPEVDR